jgi:hypothetical protein
MNLPGTFPPLKKEPKGPEGGEEEFNILQIPLDPPLIKGGNWR